MTRLVLAVALAAMFGCSKAKEAPPESATPEIVTVAPSRSAPLPAERAPSAASAPAAAHKRDRVVLEEIGVPDAPSVVNVHFEIPPGTTVNDEAPFRIRWKSSESLENAPDDVSAKGAGHEHGFRIALRPTRGAKVARLLGEVELVVCDADTHSICMPVKREVDLTFVVGGKTAPKPVGLKLPSASS